MNNSEMNENFGGPIVNLINNLYSKLLFIKHLITSLHVMFLILVYNTNADSFQSIHKTIPETRILLIQLENKIGNLLGQFTLETHSCNHLK